MVRRGSTVRVRQRALSPRNITPSSIAVAAAFGFVAVALAPLLSVRRLRDVDSATLWVVE